MRFDCTTPTGISPARLLHSDHVGALVELRTDDGGRVTGATSGITTVCVRLRRPSLLSRRQLFMLEQAKAGRKRP